MSAPAAAAVPDPKLEAAFARFFSRRERSGSVNTERSNWELFVGGQSNPAASGGTVRQITVNVVEVDPEFRRTGILQQGMALLRGRFSREQGATLVEFQAVRNPYLYAWALQQPGCYISRYRPDSIYLFDTLPPPHPNHPNMANTAITVDKVRAATEVELYGDEVHASFNDPFALDEWCRVATKEPNPSTGFYSHPPLLPPPLSEDESASKK
jgi:hypothetical protein